MDAAQFLSTKVVKIKTSSGDCNYRKTVIPSQLEFLNYQKFAGQKFLMESGTADVEDTMRPRLDSLRDGDNPEYESPWSEDDEDRYMDVKADKKAGIHYAEFPVNLRLMGVVQKNSQFKKLPEKYDVEIEVIKPGIAGDDILFRITSISRARVLRAYRDLQELIEEETKTIPPTHFICLPLVCPALTSKLEDLKEEISENNALSVGERIYMPAEKMHMTICVVKLANTAKVEKCKRVLTTIASDIYDSLETRSLPMKLSGLHCMTDDPSRTRVVYTRPDSKSLSEISKRIDRLSEKVMNVLQENDMVEDQHAYDSSAQVHIKLHATVMNVKYLHDPKKHHFDARPLLSKFSNFDFGTCVPKTLNLCVLGGETENDGFYKTIWKCALP